MVLYMHVWILNEWIESKEEEGRNATFFILICLFFVMCVMYYKDVFSREFKKGF